MCCQVLCPGLHMLLHLSAAPINLQNVGQDLESKCCNQISHSLARHFPTSACKNVYAPLIMSRLLRLSPSSFVLSSFNISVVAVVIVITIIAIVVANATTVPILTSVKTVVDAVVVVLSSLQEPGCITPQHVCYAQSWAPP